MSKLGLLLIALSGNPDHVQATQASGVFDSVLQKPLGLDALSRVEVPVPSLDAQAWFEALHARASNLRALNAAAAEDAAALLPAMLHQYFGGTT